jgi:hypothetical protein
MRVPDDSDSDGADTDVKWVEGDEAEDDAQDSERLGPLSLVDVVASLSSLVMDSSSLVSSPEEEVPDGENDDGVPLFELPLLLLLLLLLLLDERGRRRPARLAAGSPTAGPPLAGLLPSSPR